MTKAAVIALIIQGYKRRTMAIALTALLIFIVFVGALWILHRQRGNIGNRPIRRRASQKGPVASGTQPDNARKESDEWVLEIESPGCEAAHALVGQKFTQEEAPKLPLRDCKSGNCTCHYRYLPEQRKYHRRMRSDRREVIRFDKEKPDQRSRKDRRRGNWDDRSF